MTSPEPVESAGLSEAAVTAMEAAMVPLVLSAITDFLNRARDLVMAPWRRFGMLPDPAPIQDLDAWWTARISELMADLLRAARRGWDATAGQLGKAVAFDPQDPYILAQLDASENLLVNVDAEIYRMIVGAIADGADRGWTNAQIADRVENILTVTGTPNWPNRADVITRTEVRRFTNAGQFAAAQRVGAETGKIFEKIWVDRDDDRVRASHARADGQRRMLDDLFDVGGSDLLYPGHWAGRPEDVINERCRMIVRQIRR